MERRYQESKPVVLPDLRMADDLAFEGCNCYRKLPFCSWAKRLDPIKTKKMYVNSEKKFLNSRFCNPL